MMIVLLQIVLLALAPVRDGRAAGACSSSQASEDPRLRAAVERFFAAQEAEDIPAYLALWSRTAARPQPGQLKYVFDAGDDRFTAITIVRVLPFGDRVRARVTAHRQRTVQRPGGGSPIAVEGDMSISLTYVEEDGDWKLVREAPAADDLAAALLEAGTPEARAKLVEAERDLLGGSLLAALTSRGSTAAQLQDYARAAAIFERVIEIARIAGDAKAEGEGLHNLANALYFQRNYDAALERYRQRLALERDRHDDEGVAAALGGIATIHYTYAEYTTALGNYREALAIQERLGDRVGLATTLISTGNVLYLQGDYDGAIADYRRSRELSHAIMNTDGEARALEGLGRVFTAQGDYAAALEAFAGVLTEGKARRDRRAQASALQHIGDIQFRLGNVEVARASLDESRQHYEGIGDQPNVGRVWQAIALTDLVASRFAGAEQEYGKSRTICAAASDSECVAHAIVGLAFALNAQDKFAEAAASYRQAIDAFTTLDRKEEAARAEVGLSQALLGKRDLDAAQAAAVRARHYGIATGDNDIVWRALVAEARVLRRKGDRSAAVAAAQAAVAAAVELQQATDDHPGHPMPADCTTAFATVVVLQTEIGDVQAAQAAAERMRVFGLRTTLMASERDIYRRMTDQERADERTAVAELISLDAQITRQRSLPKPDTARIATLETRAAESVARRKEARVRLFERLPDLAAWRGLVPPATAADLEPLLASSAPGTVLLQFVVDEDDTVVMTTEYTDEGMKATASAIPVRRHAIAERVAAAVQPAILRDSTEWKRASADLVSLLPEAALERLRRARGVIVIPDAALWRVPFEALPISDGYLVDSRTVAYAGSVTALVMTARTADGAAVAASPEGSGESSRPGTSLVVVAAPAIAPDVRDRMLLTAPGWTPRSAAMTDEEITRVTRVYGDGVTAPVHVLSGKLATEPDVRAAAGAASVLHLAVPFRMNAASPLFSAALLTSSGDVAGDSHDDGVLEAREIVNLGVPARAAILSDGSAALMRDAQTVTGVIEWVWLAAGVPALVLNRWTADEPAPQLLAEFHKRLRAGEPSADALRTARAAVRARAEWTAPFYWAGWMAVGR